MWFDKRCRIEGLIFRPNLNHFPSIYNTLGQENILRRDLKAAIRIVLPQITDSVRITLKTPSSCLHCDMNTYFKV